MSKLGGLFGEPKVKVAEKAAVQEQKKKPTYWIEREVDLTQSIVTLELYLDLRHQANIDNMYLIPWGVYLTM